MLTSQLDYYYFKYFCFTSVITQKELKLEIQKFIKNYLWKRNEDIIGGTF